MVPSIKSAQAGWGPRIYPSRPVVPLAQRWGSPDGFRLIRTSFIRFSDEMVAQIGAKRYQCGHEQAIERKFVVVALLKRGR